MTKASPNPPAGRSAEAPEIGIPWRTSEEEAAQDRLRLGAYEEAVRRAGAQPVVLSLSDPEGLPGLLEGLGGFVLPGSPADVAPEEYGAGNLGLSEPADAARQRTDKSILEHAFREGKPVLAICYGCQLLNVYLGGSLIQDLRSETGTKQAHRKTDAEPELPEDPRHEVRFEAGSRLAKLARGVRAVTNSSHHQAVKTPGRQLEVTGQSCDGIVESVEWTGDSNWVVGVQWHPERMQGDPLAESLFTELVAAATKVPVERRPEPTAERVSESHLGER